MIRMIRSKPGTKRSIFFIFFLLIFSFSKISAQDGRTLFQNNCATCHGIKNVISAPPLEGVLDRAPYDGDIKKILRWVKNTALANSDPYYMALKEKYGQVMPTLPLSDKDFEAIINYVNVP